MDKRIEGFEETLKAMMARPGAFSETVAIAKSGERLDLVQIEFPVPHEEMMVWFGVSNHYDFPVAFTSDDIEYITAAHNYITARNIGKVRILISQIEEVRHCLLLNRNDYAEKFFAEQYDKVKTKTKRPVFQWSPAPHVLENVTGMSPDFANPKDRVAMHYITSTGMCSCSNALCATPGMHPITEAERKRLDSWGHPPSKTGAPTFTFLR